MDTTTKYYPYSYSCSYLPHHSFYCHISLLAGLRAALPSCTRWDTEKWLESLLQDPSTERQLAGNPQAVL